MQRDEDIHRRVRPCARRAEYDIPAANRLMRSREPIVQCADDIDIFAVAGRFQVDIALLNAEKFLFETEQEIVALHPVAPLKEILEILVQGLSRIGAPDSQVDFSEMAVVAQDITRAAGRLCFPGHCTAAAWAADKVCRDDSGCRNIGALCLVQQKLHCLLPHGVPVAADRCQRRLHVAADLDIVEARDENIVRDMIAQLLQRIIDAQRHQIICADEGVRQPAVLIDPFDDLYLCRVLTPTAKDNILIPYAQPVFVRDIFDCLKPRGIFHMIFRAADIYNVLYAVLEDQMPRQLLHTAVIVGQDARDTV